MASVPEQQDAVISGPIGGLGSRSPVLARPRPTPRPRIELCPYCGRESVNTTRCSTCGGYFDALSKQATQNAMGPWWLREADRPIKPGCSYDTIRSMVSRGVVTRETVLRGPTTRQFWMRASRAPGVAHLLGMCHSCQREVSPDAFMCAACGASFNTETDRQHLGLSPVSLLPGQAGADRIAAVSAASAPIAAPAVAPGGDTVFGGAAVDGGYDPAGGLGFGRPGDDAWARARLAGVRLSPAAASIATGAGASLSGDADLRFEISDAGSGDGARPRRGRGSLAGAVGMMALGAIVAAGGVWIALVRSQGGVQGALAAIGVREPIVVADAGTREPGEASEGDSQASGSQDTDRSATTIAMDPGVEEAPPPAVRPFETEVPAATSDAQSPRESLMATLLEQTRDGRWREASEAVAQLERSGALTADEAAAWRMALEARLERAELAGLP